ncbi:hypothetical protein [Methylobacterium sp.]|jgi:hypothetical protein|uniref:hypothetical protein n=1 Tax=Methylobacterium sp. TaxID=409 RepID=UPI0025F2AC23|nr:hypothetical protein [Methylobacterium sp.]MBY0256315.1 hypothetical protein [Methylobacterium sp.]
MVDTPSSDDTQTRSHDRRVAWSVAALIAGTVLVGALVPAPAAHRASAVPSADAACAEWSDGCHVCQRTEGGVACSLPGIACVPKEQSCLRRVGG